MPTIINNEILKNQIINRNWHLFLFLFWPGYFFVSKSQDNRITFKPVFQSSLLSSNLYWKVTFFLSFHKKKFIWIEPLLRGPLSYVIPLFLCPKGDLLTEVMTVFVYESLCLPKLEPHFEIMKATPPFNIMLCYLRTVDEHGGLWV